MAAPAATPDATPDDGDDSPNAASAFPGPAAAPRASPARFNYTQFSANPGLAEMFAPEIAGEQRAQAQDAANAAANQRQQNQQALYDATQSGLRTTRDGNGNVVPLTDPDTGQALYHPRTGQVQYDAQGKPYQTNRDQYGAQSTVNPDADAPVGPNTDDPTDPQLYRQNSHQAWEPLGHVDDLADDGDQPADVRAAAQGWQQKRAKLIEQAGLQAAEKTSAHAQAAHIGAQNQVATLTSQNQDLQSQLDGLDQDPNASQTQGGSAAANLAARRADLEKQQATVQTQLTGVRTQLPALKAAAQAATADASITRHGLDLSNYASMGDQRRQLLKEQGKSPDGDAVLAAIEKKTGDLNVKLSAARADKAALGDTSPPAPVQTPTGTSSSPQSPATDGSGQAPTSSAAGNAARELVGGAAAGTLRVAEGFERSMAGQEAATPASVNTALDKQIADRRVALARFDALPDAVRQTDDITRQRQTIQRELIRLQAQKANPALALPVGATPGLLTPEGQTKRDARVTAADESADTLHQAADQAGEFYGADPARKDTRLARIARAAGDAAPLVASSFVPGGAVAGVGVAALQTKASSYDEALADAVKAGMVDQSGQPTAAAKAQAQQYSDAAALRSVPEMATFLGSGKVAAGVVSRLLSPATPAATRFLVSAAMSTAANAAAGTVNQTVEQVAQGKPLDPSYSLERLVQDAMFGAGHAVGETVNASREQAATAQQFQQNTDALNAARERLGPITADAASAHLAIPHPPESDPATQANADASVAESFAARNPDAPAIDPAVVSKAREFAPPGSDTSHPVVLSALDRQIDQSEAAAADATTDAARASAQAQAATAYAQKDALVRQNDTRLLAVQQISALPDWQPPADANGQPTAPPDPERNRETAGAILKIANGFSPDDLTTAEQARLKPADGAPPLTRDAPDGSTILTDAGRQQLAQAAPAAAPLIGGSEADALRARAQTASTTAAKTNIENEQEEAKSPPTDENAPETAQNVPESAHSLSGNALAERIVGNLRTQVTSQGQEFTPAREQRAREVAGIVANNLTSALQKYRNAFASIGMDVVDDEAVGSGGVHSPGPAEIRLSIGDIADLPNLNSLQNPARAERAVQEEAIHSVAQYLESKGEINPEAVWQSLPNVLQRRVEAAYPDLPSDRNKGHEALRMIVQGRLNQSPEGWSLDGNLLTEQSDPALFAQTRQAIFKLFKFFRDLHGSLVRAGAKPEDAAIVKATADRLEAVVRGVVDPGSLPPEDTEDGTAGASENPSGGVQPGSDAPDARVPGVPGIPASGTGGTFRDESPGRAPAADPNGNISIPGAENEVASHGGVGRAGGQGDQGGASTTDAPVETREPSAEERARAAAGLGVDSAQIGHVSEVTSSTGQKVRTAFAVREAADAKPSHNPEGVPTPGYPQEFQPRDRSAASYRRQAQNIAGDLDLDRLAESPRPDEGSPVVTGSGHTLTGNGRDIAIGLAYRQGMSAAGRYKTRLFQRAPELGLDRAAVARMKAPVLHRVILGHESPEALRRFSEDSNASPAMASNSLETATQDARRLTPPLLSLFDPNFDLESPKNADFLKAFGQQVVLGKNRVGEGNANELNIAPSDLARRARLALFSAAYGGDPAGRVALERMGGDTEDRGRNISQALLTLAPVMARLRADSESGDLHPGFDLSTPLVRAAQEISEAVANRPPKQSAGAAIDGLLAQQTFDTDPLERAALGFFARNRTNRAALEEGLSNYAESVYRLGNPKDGADMFGERQLPAPLELFMKAASPTLHSQRAAERPNAVTDFRQSLLSRPALPTVDENGVHDLAKPRGTAYLSEDEQQRDPAHVLQTLVRRDASANGRQRWKPGRELAGHARLVEENAAMGREIDPAAVQDQIFAAPPEHAGGEHVVVPDKPSGRVYKFTKPGLYGAQGEDAGAYLQRWALHNRAFGGDAKYEGQVHLPGEDEPRTVISQPFVDGRDSTAPEQADYLRSHGFHEQPDGTFINPVTGLKVWDTITPGNAKTTPEGEVRPIDLQVAPAGPEELARARAASGVGQDPVFSQRAGGTDKLHAQTAEETSETSTSHPIDDLLSLLDEGGRGDAVDRYQQQSSDETQAREAATTAGARDLPPRTVGRPDLAFGNASDAHRAVDQARADEQVAQTHAGWNQEADRRYTADPQAEVRNLAQKALTGDQLDAVETKIAQRAVADELARPDSPEQRRKVQAMIYGYRMTGTEQARAMAARFDPHQTPEQRHREFLGRMIYTPPRDVQRQLDTLPRGDKAGRQRILDADQQRVSRIEAELKKMGVSFDDIFSGEVELKLKGAKIINNTSTQLFDGARQRAIKLLQGGGRTFADVATATGLAEGEVKKAYGQMREALKAKLRDKVRRGATAENLDMQPGLLSQPAGGAEPAFKTEADTEAELDRILNQMGFFDPGKVGRMKTRAPKKAIFRPPATPADPAQLEAWKRGGVGDEVRAKVPVGQKEMNLGRPAPEGTGERAGSRFTRETGDEQGRIDFAGQEPPTGGGTGERAGGKYLQGAQGRMDFADEPSRVSPIDLSDPVVASRLSRAIQAADSNVYDKAFEFWSAGLLSGPQTHIAIGIGNTLNAGFELTVQRGMESMLNLAYQDKNSAQPGEMKYILRGLMPGIRQGLNIGLKSFQAEASMFEPTFLDQQLTLDPGEHMNAGHKVALQGKLGKIVRLPFRAVGFMDGFMKTAIWHMQVGAESYRMAKAEGLQGTFLAKRMEELNAPGSEAAIRAVTRAEEMIGQAPYLSDDSKAQTDAQAQRVDAAYRQARAEGKTGDAITERATELLRAPDTGGWRRFVPPGLEHNPLDVAMSHFQTMARSTKLLSYVFPYLRMPYNLMKMGLRKSPLGVTNIAARLINSGLYKLKEGRPILQSYPAALQTRHLAEQAFAWTAASLLYGAVEGDGEDDRKKRLLITGSRSFRDDKKGERELLERTAGGAMTLRVGNTTINYGRYEPIATVLATMADAARTIKAMKNGAGKADAVDKFVGYVTDQVSSKSMLQGMSDLQKDVSGGTGTADRTKRALMTALVPNIIRQPLRNLDSYVRDSHGAPAPYSFFPAGGFAEKKLTPYGQPVEKTGNPLSRVLFPATAKPTERLNLADQMLMNWNAKHPGETWAPEPLSRKKPDPKTGKETEMTNEEYATYQRRAALKLSVRLAGVLNSSNAHHPTEADLHALKTAFSQAHHEAKQEAFGTKKEPLPTAPLPRSSPHPRDTGTMLGVK